MDHIHTTPWMDCSQKPLELDLSEPDKTSEMMHKNNILSLIHGAPSHK